MEKLVDEGKTKLIGVSNFSTPKLKRLLGVCRIHPVVNQVELHPYFPQKGLVEFCQKNEIHVTAYSPLGCTPVPYLIERRGPGPLEDPTVRFHTVQSIHRVNLKADRFQINQLAKKYSRTPAQVILSHMIHLGVSVIPKNNSRGRISENFDCLFELEQADYKLLGNLMGARGERGVRNLETREYLGFDNFNEEVEEP
ncbi:MAG: hypothetical protein M1840_003229 [Geoglossum simile]|nr:MAG: hypothetical protein M1840_003229 [Geoglossum simile]